MSDWSTFWQIQHADQVLCRLRFVQTGDDGEIFVLHHERKSVRVRQAAAGEVAKLVGELSHYDGWRLRRKRKSHRSLQTAGGRYCLRESKLHFFLDDAT